MRMVPKMLTLAACLLVLAVSIGTAPASVDQAVVLVYTGRMLQFGEGIAQIVRETGTRVLLVTSDDVLRGLANLPQIRCIVIAAFAQSDLAFLGQFAPALVRYFEEGGSLVGIGPVCSQIAEERLAQTIFPIRGNATGVGTRIGDLYGSAYILSDPVDGIVEGIPDRFVITQSQFTYNLGAGGVVEPYSQMGTPRVVYREESTGTPMVVALEGIGGGRSVSLPGCYVAEVERLPFHWSRLLNQTAFRDLLKGCVGWAMEGSRRYEAVGLSVNEDLRRELQRMTARRELVQEANREAGGKRFIFLATIWGLGLAFQALLAAKLVVPRMRKRPS